METWQTDVAVRAEQAANLCFVCERYGHYPIECPTIVAKKRPQPAATPKESSSTAYAWFMGFVVGLVLGMCLMKGWMS